VRRELFAESQRGSIIFLFEKEINGGAFDGAISSPANGRLRFPGADVFFPGADVFFPGAAAFVSRRGRFRCPRGLSRVPGAYFPPKFHAETSAPFPRNFRGIARASLPGRPICFEAGSSPGLEFVSVRFRPAVGSGGR
jgi:hypothetical protein